ncbi:MAG: ankyrin repeat domain-containing protein [Acidimicrobiia bacterium]|nr:ankyrin repeat domain-containing protein [Acidimicrobiia bacterium]MBV9041056.1 ankyrin repeat domain-containing protein [Acidimicrobiia bacterium]MBV9285796.1 ankyrin repeat domain-containing protein [Acidimicrobiia bacterium]
MLRVTPQLALAAMEVGATRQDATTYYLEAIHHYVYAGDTPLHIAAASHRPDIVRMLLDLGADVGARNRRGAQPLHYAADGAANSDGWDPAGQAAVIEALVAAGADANAADNSGVAPLHRAVRTRSADAVRALLQSGADPDLTNGSGSSPMKLATTTTGKSGSGTPAAREQQAMIVEMLESHR